MVRLALDATERDMNIGHGQEKWRTLGAWTGAWNRPDPVATPPHSLTHVSCGRPKSRANLELGTGPDAAEGEAPEGQITRPPLACGHPNTAGESDGKRGAFF